MALTKKIMGALIVAGLFFAVELSAKSIYVSSLRTALFNGPSNASGKKAVLTRGMALNVISTKGMWVQVSTSQGDGWVKRMFTRSSRPGGTVSALGSRANINVQARRRASADVTAASARGLDDEGAMVRSGRTRSSSAKKAFDPQALEKMESIIIEEQELMLFLKEGNLTN